MIARFDLYDFVANLIPGLVFLWCAQRLAALFGWPLPLDFTGGLAETSILIALGYITGILLQGLSHEVVEKRILKPLWGGFPSERWLLPDDGHFSKAYKARLLEQIGKLFGVSTEPDPPPDCPPDKVHELRLKKNRELFYLVYHAVGEASPRPLAFNAQYGLFRVLVTMFGGLGIVSLIGMIWAGVLHPAQFRWFAMWFIVFGLAACIAYLRCKKRAEDFAESVYALFMTAQVQKSVVPENENRPETAQRDL